MTEIRKKHTEREVIEMDLRLAVMQDLPQLKNMYVKIIEEMNKNQIPIWDDIYPCSFFEEDILKNQLYLMLDDAEIVSAFALCDSNTGANTVAWENPFCKALYLDRLGVNPGYLRKGMGSLTLAKAKETAKTLGAGYLRLFVVDINTPAIQLYTKNGFVRANGIYNEVIDADCILHEFGYETKL